MGAAGRVNREGFGPLSVARCAFTDFIGGSSAAAQAGGVAGCALAGAARPGRWPLALAVPLALAGAARGVAFDRARRTKFRNFAKVRVVERTMSKNQSPDGVECSRVGDRAAAH